MGDNSPSKQIYFFGGLRVCMALLCFGNYASPQHWSILRAIHTLNTPKNYIPLPGESSLSKRRCWSGAQGLMWGARGAFLRVAAMVAMVVFVIVGCWRLTSDWSTVGIVRIVYGSNFLYSSVDPIHSSHLTWQLKNKDLDLWIWFFRWFLTLRNQLGYPVPPGLISLSIRPSVCSEYQKTDF